MRGQKIHVSKYMYQKNTCIKILCGRKIHVSKYMSRMHVKCVCGRKIHGKCVGGTYMYQNKIHVSKFCFSGSIFNTEKHDIKISEIPRILRNFFDVKCPK